jgi:hypothetical protein
MCRPRCETPPNEVPFSLVDVSASAKQISATGDEYTIEFSAPVAGTYKGTISVLRPGFIEARFFDSDLMHRRLKWAIVRGPTDFEWRNMDASDGVPSNRFVVELVGWLRVTAQETYNFLISSDGSGRLLLNGTEVLRFPSEDGLTNMSKDIDLKPGFIPLQLEYKQWANERGANSFLRLYYSSGSVPFQLVPESALYYEEVLSQPKNPFDHVVHPFPRAASLAVEGIWSDRQEMWSTGMAGVPYSVRLHSIDRYGNVLNVRDPTASVYVNAEPLFVDGELEGDVLAANRWRVTPLANASWDVVLRPDAAPAVYNVSFTLRSLEAAGTVFTRQIQIPIAPNQVDAVTSLIVCMPQAPQVVGTRVTCTVLPRDLERNDLFYSEITFKVRRPSDVRETTLGGKTLSRNMEWSPEHVENVPITSNKAREFRFFPTVPGTWIAEATVIYDKNISMSLQTVNYDVVTGPPSPTSSDVDIPPLILTGEPFTVNISLYDSYGIPIKSRTDKLVARMWGGFHDSVNVLAKIRQVSLNYPPQYQADFPIIERREGYQMSVSLLTISSNESLTLCPELLPIFGRVDRLSKYRAAGSVAMMSCLAGFEYTSGSRELRCQFMETDLGILGESRLGQWLDLESYQSSILVCEKKIYWCPPLNLVNSEITVWDWRRDVGSKAALRCQEGQRLMVGDTDIVCGSRDGAGTWLSLEGDKAVPVVCAPRQHVCPPLDLADHVQVTNMSADRDAGSVVSLHCDPAYEEASLEENATAGGDKIIVCSGEGEWSKPFRETPMIPARQFQCQLIDPFCEDPAPLLQPLGPCIAHVTNSTHRRLGGTVEFECGGGCEPLYGAREAVCAVSRRHESKGVWMNVDPNYFGQVDLKPLVCAAVQNWCMVEPPAYGFFLSLSDEYYLGSITEMACEAGYVQVGGNTALMCGPDRTWLALDGNGPSAMLVCDVADVYCTIPTPETPGTSFSLTDGQRLGSRLGMGCEQGYEGDVPREVPAVLVCRPGPGGIGQWATPDGLATPTGFLACRGVVNWCPVLWLKDGLVSNVTGGRRPVVGRANIQCNLGFELRFQGSWVGDLVGVYCHHPRQVWVTDSGYDYNLISCKPKPAFCPRILPAYTRIYAYGPMTLHERTYNISFTEDRAYRSSAKLMCNEGMD